MPRLILVLSCLVLASCLDGDEEVWIEKDGSGRIEASYRMPPQFMNDLGGGEKLVGRLRKAMQADPNMTLESATHGFENGRATLSFSTAFEDFRKLAEFGKKHLGDAASPDVKSTEQTLLGDINIKLEGLTLTYDREIDLTPIFPDNVQRNPGLLGASTFRYTLHMPVAATAHDAHTTTNDGRSLHWSYPLREHVDAPMTTSARAELPVPWWIWASGILALAIIGLLIFRMVRQTSALSRAALDGAG